MLATDIQRALTRTVPLQYEQLIAEMKFYIEPEISCSRFLGKACFTAESIDAFRTSHDPHVLELSEMGTFIAQHLKNGLWIDVPCGLAAVRDAEEDFDVASLAGMMGAADVWEIDITPDVVKDRLDYTVDVLQDGRYQLMQATGDIGMRMEGTTQIATMQDDLLGFIAKISPENRAQRKAVYISAIQPDAAFCTPVDAQGDVAVPYLTALYDELGRVCTQGDLVILNSGDMLVAGIDETVFPGVHPALALPPRGFKLMRQCAFNKVQVYLRV